MGRVTPLVVALAVSVDACHSSSDQPPPTRPAATHLCAPFGAPAPAMPPTTCPLSVAGHGKSVRVFAVGNEQNVSTNVDYARYCDAIDRVVRERVGPCLARDEPNLIVFPEDTTLAASYLGARGEEARMQGSSKNAFLDLASSYSPAIAWYATKFTGLAAGRRIELALTDVSWRVLYGVFGAMAKRYGAYVAVGANVANAQETIDDYAITRIGDASAAGPTYEATTSDVWNASIVFGPDGSLVGFEKKAYLTQDEQTSLSLSYGPLDALDPIDLPFARVGVAISKDAWMPIVRDRLDAWGADVVLHHEALGGWAIEELPGDWLPDVLMESGWTMTARAGATRAVVTPMLTGNLFDLVFDGQTHVTKTPDPNDAPLGFIGETPTDGFFAIAPWADATDTDRVALRAYGESLRPGGPRDDQYIEGVVAVDLDIHKDGAYAPTVRSAPVSPGIFGASMALAASSAPQRHVALASRGTHALIAWEEGAPGGGDVRTATYVGSAFSPSYAISTARARLPAITVTGAGDIGGAIVWEQDGSDGKAQVLLAEFDGAAWTPSVSLPSAGAAQWAPSIAGTRFNGYTVAWHDLRDGGRSHVWLEHVTGGVGAAPFRLDPTHVDPTPRGDEWSVRLAADDYGVHATWIDFRNGSWDVMYARSNDAIGTSFSTPVRVNHPTKPVGTPPVELERLESDPTITLDLGGQPIIAWTSLQERKPFAATAYGRSVGGVFGEEPLEGVQPSLAIDASGGVHVVTVANGQVMLDFGDTSRRVSDAPPGAHVARPRMRRIGDNTVLIAWEDDRDGPTAIRYVVGTLP